MKSRIPPEQQARLQERRRRMFSLLLNNAPDQIVFNEARLLLLSEARENTWLALWYWIAKDARELLIWTKFYARCWYWRRNGYSEACAIGLATGDTLETHRKHGCNCEENFEEELRRMLERESQ